MRIAICGSAPSTVRLAPYIDASIKQATAALPVHPAPEYQDQAWEIWGCSPALFGVASRVSRWFEMHRYEPGQPWFSPEYCLWLNKFRGPVYTGGLVPQIPNAVIYPLAAIEAEFSSYFLTSSVALMQALAIVEIENARKAGAIAQDEGTIGLFGVDMAANEEWNEQRPGCQFFVLEALRRGIMVYVPPESDLLRPMPVYGLSEWTHQYIKGTARAKELSARRNEAVQRMEQARAEAAHLTGAMDDHNWQIKTWCSPYGLPHGIYLRHEPGTGLGGGVDVNRVAPPAERLGAPIAPARTPIELAGKVTHAGTARAYAGRVKTELPDLGEPTTAGPKRKRGGRRKR